MSSQCSFEKQAPDGGPVGDPERASSGDAGDDVLRRLRQNSASMVAVLPARAATAGDASLGITSPAWITILAVAAWALLTLAGPFDAAAAKLGQLLLAVLLVLGLSAVHELGHVIAGRIVGLKLLSLTVGPLAIVHTPRGYEPSVNGQWIRFAGCVEHDIPPGRTSRLRLSVSALGGPAANLLLAGLLAALAPAQSFVGSLALWSFVFGAVNLVPIKMNGQTSDGGIVWRLWSRDESDVAWREGLLGTK